MSIEIQTLDSLRALVRKLQTENKELRELLKKNNISFSAEKAFRENSDNSIQYDTDQGSRIIPHELAKEDATTLVSYFWGRADVYAKRAKSGHYYPQCHNRWDNSLCQIQRGDTKGCIGCPNVKWKKITRDAIEKHLMGQRQDGDDVIGIYPLLADDTCRLLAFDFDNHEKGSEKTDFANADDSWKEEENALRKICERVGIDVLVERSRSGKGAHIWIFFSGKVKASEARDFGNLLLDAVIDNSLVWHGGMNLLGKADAWDNLMRIYSQSAASELLERAYYKKLE